jgi:hypothetical protein
MDVLTQKASNEGDVKMTADVGTEKNHIYLVYLLAGHKN